MNLQVIDVVNGFVWGGIHILPYVKNEYMFIGIHR
jgi:hypothetical protein